MVSNLNSIWKYRIKYTRLRWTIFVIWVKGSSKKWLQFIGCPQSTILRLTKKFEEIDSMCKWAYRCDWPVLTNETLETTNAIYHCIEQLNSLTRHMVAYRGHVTWTCTPTRCSLYTNCSWQTMPHIPNSVIGFIKVNNTNNEIDKEIRRNCQHEQVSTSKWSNTVDKWNFGNVATAFVEEPLFIIASSYSTAWHAVRQHTKGDMSLKHAFIQGAAWTQTAADSPCHTYPILSLVYSFHWLFTILNTTWLLDEV